MDLQRIEELGSSAGGADAYKAELLYRPVDALQIRSSYQHAVRVPSVFELYVPQLPTFPYSAGDPCEEGSGQRKGSDRAKDEALCLAQGLPIERLPDYNDPDGFVRGFVGGNPDLDPETADTLTAGIVFTWSSASQWLDRLQLSLDWYRIEIDDAIVTIYASDFIARCFDRTFNPEFVVSNEWCGMFARDTEHGDIVDAYEILRNSAGLRTAGIDLQLDWRFDAGPGEVGVNWLVSHVNSFERLELPGLPITELVGTAGSNFSMARR
jgi:outer membrane receptor protein involved in Fe transport